MPTMKSLPLSAVAALIAGALAATAMTFVPLFLVDRGHGGKISAVFRGTDGWHVARDEAFGLAWVNLQLMDTPLLSPIEDGELPHWAEPPKGPHPPAPLYRIGTLVSGWPLPSMCMRWSATTLDRNFPMPAQLDDQDTTIGSAAEDFLMKNRSGGPDKVTVLWRGALANTAIFAVPVFALLVLRGHAATRREAAAAAR